MFSVTVGIDGLEHAADKVKGTVEIGPGINEIEAHSLADSGSKWLVLVLESYPVKDNFVGSYG
jgi:hypothetical protein